VEEIGTFRLNRLRMIESRNIHVSTARSELDDWTLRRWINNLSS